MPIVLKLQWLHVHESIEVSTITKVKLKRHKLI